MLGRIRAWLGRRRLDKAVADGASSLLLDVQQECIQLRLSNTAMRTLLRDIDAHVSAQRGCDPDSEEAVKLMPVEARELWLRVRDAIKEEG